MGRSFYSPNLGTRQPLGDGLESWRGFYQSIRPTQMGLSLNIGNESLFIYLHSWGIEVMSSFEHLNFVRVK